ncbi:putative sulfate exporter family transporter [Saccharomonospora sp. NPDC006951]
MAGMGIEIPAAAGASLPRVLAGFRRVAKPAPGLLIALAVAGVATALGQLVPVVGGPVFGIVLGAALAAAVPAARGSRLRPGYDVAGKPVLQLSIVVLGTGLSLRQVWQAGGESLPVMLGTLAVALAGAVVFGRLLKVGGDTSTLIGVGTGICGASAIAATTAVLKPKDSEVAYALGTIFTFNIVAVLAFPPIGRLLGMDPHAFGLLSGTAINDTSSVVAAAYAYGADAGEYAIVVKLTRALMLVPIVIGIALLVARRQRRASGGPASPAARIPWHKVVPLFLVGFVAAAALGSLGVIPHGWQPALAWLGTFLITTALAGIGLAMRPSDVRGAGPRPLLLGGVLWIAVTATSLGLQALTGTL